MNTAKTAPALDERLLGGLRVFLAVVDAASFARAGDVLQMSQPGVSRAVARLEARLKVRLLDRTTRRVALTDDGRRFMQAVAPALAALEEAAASATGAASVVRGRLRVNVDPLFSRLMLGPQLGGFMAGHPELQLELLTRDQLGDLVADGFDLAVRFGPQRDSSLVAKKLMDTRILTVAAPAYLKRVGTPSHPKELLDGRHVCIEFRDPLTGRPFPWEFHPRDKRKKPLLLHTGGRLVLNDGGTLFSCCLAGYGVAQVMAMSVQQLLAQGQLVQLFPDWAEETFPLFAYHPSRHHPPAKTRAFLDFVVQVASR